jgi:hypothetical protein
VYGQSNGVGNVPAYLPALDQLAKPAAEPAPVVNACYMVTGDPALAQKLEMIGKALAQTSDQKEIALCRFQQAEILAQAVPNLNAEQREPILRQIADSLCDAVRYDRTAYARLLGLEKQVTQTMPGSDVAAYVTFREMQASEAGVIQAGCLHTRLADFVEKYPRASDTPQAMLQLALSCELTGKSDEAKQWYAQLASAFPNTPLAAKGEGALRRLNLEGKVLHLALPLLFSDDEHKDVPFDIDELRGKTVIVYFWSSSQESASTDLRRFGAMVRAHSNVALLSVNLDQNPNTARATLREDATPCTHIFQRGGVDGVVARRFGIISLPHMMLVAPTGVVVRQSVESTALGELIP